MASSQGFYTSSEVSLWAFIPNLQDFPLDMEKIPQHKYIAKCHIQHFLFTKDLFYLIKITHSWKAILVSKYRGFFLTFVKGKLLDDSVNLLWAGHYWDICKIKFLAGFIENKTKQKSIFSIKHFTFVCISVIFFLFLNYSYLDIKYSYKPMHLGIMSLD